MAQKLSWLALGQSFCARLPVLILLLLLSSGCSARPRAWGFPGGSGTVDRQKARASVHDPFPLNDIGPDVMGGRPREFAEPRTEAAREANIPKQYRNLPPSY
jgi:hypothetical protein